MHISMGDEKFSTKGFLKIEFLETVPLLYAFGLFLRKLYNCLVVRNLYFLLFGILPKSKLLSRLYVRIASPLR